MQTEFKYDCTPRFAHFANKFTGKERDTESGLDYFGARYYSSNMGRWMSPDWSEDPYPVPYADLENFQSLNLYGYVGNNPLSKNDADGHIMLNPDCPCNIDYGFLGVPSENGPDRTLRLTQRPEFAFTEFRGVAPLVVAGEIDVLPAKRVKMLSERRVWGMPVFA